MKNRKRRALLAHEVEECNKLKAIFEKRKAEAHARGERLTQSDVGEACGWASGQSVVNQYMSGKLALNLDALMRLAKVLRFTPEEVSPRLATAINQIAKLAKAAQDAPDHEVSLGNGMSIQFEPDSKWFENRNIEGEKLHVKAGQIPVIGKATLGPEGFFEAMDYPVGHGEGFLDIFSSDENAYGLRVVGNSMMPRIKNNEFVLIEPGKKYVAGDEVLVTTISGQSMIKEFMYHRDGQYRFDSVNAEYDPIYIGESDVASVHYVGAIIKGSRFTPQ